MPNKKKKKRTGTIPKGPTKTEKVLGAIHDVADAYISGGTLPRTKSTATKKTIARKSDLKRKQERIDYAKRNTKNKNKLLPGINKGKKSSDDVFVKAGNRNRKGKKHIPEGY